MIKKIGLGGGCHWCTEAVFASLQGVEKVEQGWIASEFPHHAFSEAVIVTYHPEYITLKDLIQIHLHTHAATSNHSMRQKYRSAIYWFELEDAVPARNLLNELQAAIDAPLVTLILPFAHFKSSVSAHLDYYYSNPEKPFCKVYIDPKIQLLRKRYSKLMKEENRNEK